MIMDEDKMDEVIHTSNHRDNYSIHNPGIPEVENARGGGFDPGKEDRVYRKHPCNNGGVALHLFCSIWMECLIAWPALISM